MRAFGGYYNSGVVYVNERIVFHGNKRQKSRKFIQSLLMHEVGHHNTSDSSIVEREYKAQVWAINHAKKLNLTELHGNLIHALKNEWTLDFYKSYGYGWNSCYRRYFLASRLAKKRGII